MTTVNITIAVISFRKSNLIQLGERFDIFVTKSCSEKSMT